MCVCVCVCMSVTLSMFGRLEPPPIIHTVAIYLYIKLGLAHRQDCRMCGNKKEDSVRTVCLYLALTCYRYRSLGPTFLTPKDLENIRVNGLTSLVANTCLGLIP